MCSVPGYGVEEVADSTMCLILNLYRRTYWLSNMVREGKRFSGPESLREAAQGSARIRGDTLGLVGLGEQLYCTCFKVCSFGAENLGRIHSNGQWPCVRCDPTFECLWVQWIKMSCSQIPLAWGF